MKRMGQLDGDAQPTCVAQVSRFAVFPSNPPWQVQATLHGSLYISPACQASKPCSCHLHGKHPETLAPPLDREGSSTPSCIVRAHCRNAPSTLRRSAFIYVDCQGLSGCSSTVIASVGAAASQGLLELPSSGWARVQQPGAARQSGGLGPGLDYENMHSDSLLVLLDATTHQVEVYAAIWPELTWG